MEKISMKVTPAVDSALGMKRAAHAMAPMSAAQPGARPNGVADASFATVFADLLTAVDLGASFTAHGWAGADPTATNALDDSASLGDYEALLQTSGEKGDGGFHGNPLHMVPRMGVQTIDSSSRAAPQDRSMVIQTELASSEHFSIDHPAWGFLEVDSRRSGAAWEVVVRCAETSTRQRLKYHEDEFRELLRRDYGISLALDVQPAVAS